MPRRARATRSTPPCSPATARASRSSRSSVSTRGSTGRARGCGSARERYGRVVLLGFSLGSLVAMQLASEEPDGLAGLVVMGNALTLRAAMGVPLGLWHRLGRPDARRVSPQAARGRSRRRQRDGLARDLRPPPGACRPRGLPRRRARTPRRPAASRARRSSCTAAAIASARGRTPSGWPTTSARATSACASSSRARTSSRATASAKRSPARSLAFLARLDHRGVMLAIGAQGSVHAAEATRASPRIAQGRLASPTSTAMAAMSRRLPRHCPPEAGIDGKGSGAPMQARACPTTTAEAPAVAATAPARRSVQQRLLAREHAANVAEHRVSTLVTGRRIACERQENERPLHRRAPTSPASPRSSGGGAPTRA